MTTSKRQARKLQNARDKLFAQAMRCLRSLMCDGNFDGPAWDSALNDARRYYTAGGRGHCR